MSDQLSLFDEGLYFLDNLYTHSNSEQVAEATRGTIDDYLFGTRLLSGEGRERQIELLQDLRERVGLPRFELRPGIEPGCDVLDFDFNELAVINSLGVVIHKFCGDKKMRPGWRGEKRLSETSTAMQQVFDLSNTISRATSWTLTTDMYDVVNLESDTSQTFNSRFLVVKKILGSRIAITDSTPRKVMTVEPFKVREIERDT